MSKIRKARKLRTPNVPVSTGPIVSSGVSAELARAGSINETAAPAFDYSETRKDLKRIGILAASFIAILVALSFFVR
ncbi:MAG: hypothetical protein ACT4QE_26255 [Anaerolineales bacterium]